MSGPKCGEYTVVSEEELRRRRLLAAQERFARAAAAATASNARVAAANQTFPELREPLLRIDRPSSTDPDLWENASHGLEQAAESVIARIDTRVAQLRAAAFAHSLSGVMTASFAADQPAQRRRTVPTHEAVQAERERLLAALSLVPPGAACEQECERLARRWADEPSENRRELILSQIKMSVQEDLDRRRAMSRRHAMLAKLKCELDGLVSDEILDLKLTLERHSLEQEVSPRLEAAVARAAARAQAELDRHFVVDAVSGVLADLGYRVDETFGTALTSGGAVLDLTSSSRHGVRVREHDGQLLFNVVRYQDPRDAAADREAEESFCRDFSNLRSQMDARGVALRMTRLDPPGATSTQLAVRGAKTAAREEGERDAEDQERAR